MNGTSFKSFAAVQDSCAVHENIDNYGIESWLKSAKSLYKRAQVAEAEGQLIDAYINYSKTYEICYTVIPGHHRYAEWKASNASQEACQEYRKFRLHLQSEMDQLIRLQKQIKSFFSSRRLSAAPPPNGRNAEIRPVSPGKITTDDVAARLARLGNIQTSTRALQSESNGPKSKPQGARPLFPKSISIEPQKLLSYQMDYPNLDILFLDVRAESDYEASHIATENIVNIDPIVCRPDLSSQDIEDSLAVGAEAHLSLFERRHGFDLLVIYDQSSRTLLSSEASRENHHPEALQNLHGALWERMGWRKPLIRSPVVLIGGLDGWVAAGGSTTKALYSSHEDIDGDSNHSRAKSILIQHPSDHSATLSDKKSIGARA